MRRLRANTLIFFFFSSRRRHTRCYRDWSSDVCSSDLALRIDPYLLTAAKAHPDRAEHIREIAGELAGARIALMHGDLSPKNILVGPDGPIILDAETACYGDPAFDLAFCLNHLLLKCVWKPAQTRAYCASFAVLRDAYLSKVDWA